MEKKHINPSTLFDSKQYGFSQIVVANPGKHVFISGQVAWDENQNIVAKGDLAQQTEKSIDNLRAALHAAGGSLENITMLRLYIVKNQIKNSETISKVLIKNFGTDTPPASTWLSVDGLANEDFMIEIEAQAVI